MAKIYVAGKDIERARKVMEALEKNGHLIAFDWVDDWLNDKNSKGTAKLAIAEYKAVKDSDGLVYLWEPDQESARYEAGMAMALDIPIVVSGNREAFFFQLSNVHVVDSDESVIKKINELFPVA